MFCPPCLLQSNGSVVFRNIDSWHLRDPPPWAGDENHSLSMTPIPRFFSRRERQHLSFPNHLCFTPYSLPGLSYFADKGYQLGRINPPVLTLPFFRQKSNNFSKMTVLNSGSMFSVQFVSFHLPSSPLQAPYGQLGSRTNVSSPWAQVCMCLT